MNPYSLDREPFRDKIDPSNLGQELLAQLMLNILKDPEQPQKQNFHE